MTLHTRLQKLESNMPADDHNDGDCYGLHIWLVSVVTDEAARADYQRYLDGLAPGPLCRCGRPRVVEVCEIGPEVLP